MLEQIVFVTKDTYRPGKYTGHFSYRLDDSAPASFDLSGTYAGRMRSLDASITYSLKAELVTKHHAKPSVAVTTVGLLPRRFAYPVYLLSDHALKAVRVLGVVSKGDCEISARMDQQEWVSGDNLLVHTLIHNRSSMHMSSISLKLYEIISAAVLGYKPAEDSKCVNHTTTPGVRTGAQYNRVLSLPLRLKSGSSPIRPTISGAANLHLTYKLVIECKFTMATGVKVELPVVVLPRGISGDVDPALKLDSAAFAAVTPMARGCVGRKTC